jgi:hypothetical protein
MHAQLFWLTCILTWGTIKLLSSRNTLDARILEEETQWTYGQILPVLLLVMPVLGVVATLSVETKREPAAAADSVGPVKRGEAATESSAGSSCAVRLLRSLPSDGSLETMDKDDGLVVVPDWLARSYYYDTFWVGYCIFFECIAIVVLVVLLLCVVFNLGDGMGLESQFRLLDFWVGVFGGVYMLLALPLASFTFFFVGLELDGWFQKPGGRVGKHGVMLLLGAGIYTGYAMVINAIR